MFVLEQTGNNRQVKKNRTAAFSQEREIEELPMSFEETPENDSDYLDDEFDHIAKSRGNQTRRTTFVVQLQRKSLTSEEIKKKGGGLMNLMSGLKVKLSIVQRFELLLKILRNRKKPKQDGEI